MLFNERDLSKPIDFYITNPVIVEKLKLRGIRCLSDLIPFFFFNNITDVKEMFTDLFSEEEYSQFLDFIEPLLEKYSKTILNLRLLTSKEKPEEKYFEKLEKEVKFPLKLYHQGYLYIGRQVISVENPENLEKSKPTLILGKPVYISVQALCNGTLIMGVKGSGKSVLLRNLGVLLSLAGVSTVYFDVHRECVAMGRSQMKYRSEYFKKAWWLPPYTHTEKAVVNISGKQIGTPLSFFTNFNLIWSIFKEVDKSFQDRNQKVLRKVFKFFMEQGKNYTLEDIKNFLKMLLKDPDLREKFHLKNNEGAIVDTLDKLNYSIYQVFDRQPADINLFSRFVKVPKEARANDGFTKVASITVIDVSDLSNLEKRLLLYYYLARVNQRRIEVLSDFSIKDPSSVFPPVVFMIDEAPSYLPDYTSPLNYAIKSTVEEGRKRGVGFILITQYSTSISPEVRNVGTYFIMGVMSETEIERFREITLHPSSKLITRLPRAYSFVFSPYWYPEPFFIRHRKLNVNDFE